MAIMLNYTTANSRFKERIINMAIVFFDFDGTLVDEKTKIYRPTKTTIQSIEQLQKNGHYAVLATGRAKCYVPETGIKWDGIIASNGAYAEINGRVVYNNEVNEELVKELINLSGKLGYFYVLENQDICYTNGFRNDDFMKVLEFFDINRQNFRPVEEAERLRANKMFLTCDGEEHFRTLCREFQGKFILGMHRGGKSCDCDPVGNNKGVGIANIAAKVNIDIRDTYAFGDSVNDYDMLKNAGHGIAMGEHRVELEYVAEYITDTVKNEGVTKGLKKYELI